MPSFDGDNLTITLDSGATLVDVKIDLYSDWKEFVQQGDNGKFLPAFRATGGDPLTGALEAGAFFFLRNDLGWRIKPPEENTTIFLTGNLAGENDTLPMILPSDGGFTVLILGLQPITQGTDVLQRAIAKAATKKDLLIFR